MNNQEIQNELLQVQKEIAELPAGYISKKIINGKTRYYLQWSEGGKKKSKYVDDALVDDLRAKIERRRELQKREKELTFMFPKPQKTEKQVKEKHVFRTDVMLGENLKSYVQTVANYKKRSLYKNICDYVYGDVRDRVFILYGLRRTGKTTLIRQVIAEMNEEDFSKTAFIQVSAGIGLSPPGGHSSPAASSTCTRQYICRVRNENRIIGYRFARILLFRRRAAI